MEMQGLLARGEQDGKGLRDKVEGLKASLADKRRRLEELEVAHQTKLQEEIGDWKLRLSKSEVEHVVLGCCTLASWVFVTSQALLRGLTSLLKLGHPVHPNT